MDEESAGLLGVLLIVTALVLSQSLHLGNAASPLPQVKWQDVVSSFGCGHADGTGCDIAMTQ